MSQIQAEATVQDSIGSETTDLATIVAVIARSSIVVAAPEHRLPAGFDETDLAILDWIAAEGRRAGQDFIRM